MHIKWISLLIVFCVFGFFGVKTAQSNEMLEVGNAAPDFTAKTFDGQELTLSKLLAESPVVLVFIRGFS